MTQPWPADPAEIAKKLKELQSRYNRIFTSKSSSKNTSNNVATSELISEKTKHNTIQQHHIQNCTFLPDNKNIQQLKKEDQFKRMRLAQQIKYSLEPTFVIHGSVVWIQKSQSVYGSEITIPEPIVTCFYILLKSQRPM